MSKKTSSTVTGYLPADTPSFGKMILFALQQVLVMFPATVTVALLAGLHVSTAIFASGVSTICFLLITKGQIPLYFGSRFAYIPAIAAITGASFGEVAPDALISQAQFGVICSGFVSIIAGIVVMKVGMKKIERVLSPAVTGSIALIIGVSLAGTAMTQAAGYDAATGLASNSAWIVAIITLLATILFSVYLKGVWGKFLFYWEY